MKKQTTKQAKTEAITETLITPKQLLSTENIGLKTWLEEGTITDKKNEIIFKPLVHTDGLSQLLIDFLRMEVVVTGGKTAKLAAAQAIAKKYSIASDEEKIVLKKEFIDALIDICGDYATKLLIAFYSQTPPYLVAAAANGYFSQSSSYPIINHIADHIILKPMEPKITLLFGLQKKTSGHQDPAIILTVTGRLAIERRTIEGEEKICKQLEFGNKDITITSDLTDKGFALRPFTTDTPNVFLKNKMDSELESKIFQNKLISILKTYKDAFKMVILRHYIAPLKAKRVLLFKRKGCKRAENLFTAITKAESFEALKKVLADHLCRTETNLLRTHSGNLTPGSLDSFIFAHCNKELSILFNYEISKYPQKIEDIEDIRDRFIAKFKTAEETSTMPTKSL